MSKYNVLWEYLKEKDKDVYNLSFADIKSIIGFEIDHSFLIFKKDLKQYGYEVEKIAMRDKRIIITKLKPRFPKEKISEKAKTNTSSATIQKACNADILSKIYKVEKTNPKLKIEDRIENMIDISKEKEKALEKVTKKIDVVEKEKQKLQKLRTPKNNNAKNI